MLVFLGDVPVRASFREAFSQILLLEQRAMRVKQITSQAEIEYVRPVAFRTERPIRASRRALLRFMLPEPVVRLQDFQVEAAGVLRTC